MSKSAEQYNKYAQDYDAFSRTAAPWVFMDKPTIEKELDPFLKSDSKILEMGCGSGKVMELMRDRGVLQQNMMGIDTSKELVKLASRHLPNSQFVLGDISDDKLIPAKNSFDVIVSVRTLEYLTIPDLGKTMANAFNALKAHGIFFIIVGHPLRVNDGDLTQYLERGWRTVSLPWGMKVELYHKTISDYINAARKAGFGISSLDETAPPAELFESDPEAYRKYLSYGATNLLLILEK